MSIALHRDEGDRLLVLTGAGCSAESGTPTYRGCLPPPARITDPYCAARVVLRPPWPSYAAPMKRAVIFAMLTGCATMPRTSPRDALVGEWRVDVVHGPDERWARAHELGGVSLAADGHARLALCERTHFNAYDIYCDAPRACFEGRWRMDGPELVVEANGRSWRGKVNDVGKSRVWFAPIWGEGMVAATLSPADAAITCDPP